MYIIFCVYLLQQSPGIHQLEHYAHKSEAVWSPVQEVKCNYVVRQPRLTDMTKKYYGYCPYWIDPVYYQYFQMELLTHMAYFSVEIDPSTGGLNSIPNQDRFFTMRDLAHQNGVFVHMTFIIFGSSNVSNFLNNISARQNAIANISSFITNYGIDGVNIDFEFVVGSVRDSFSLFIHNLNQALINHPGGNKELYLASIAVPEWYPGYDVAYLADNCDGLFIMAYDFHYSGSSIAGPVSPCVPSSFWGQYCCAHSIGSYKACGVDTSKIILGVPYYGYDWPTVSQDIGSNTIGTGSAVIYYNAFQNANTYGRLWDNYSLTPWYRYYSGDWHQAWYDDSVSIDIKFSLVNDSSLAGAGCWALGYDRDYDHLWNAVRKNFWDSLKVTEHAIYRPNTLVDFANIFSHSLKLRFADDGSWKKVMIYDITGRELTNIKTARNYVELGNELKPGIFFLIIKTDYNKILKYKIVKLSN